MAKMSSPQKDGKNHTKLKMTKMSHHQKDGKKSHPKKMAKYVAPPKSRIVKKDDKNVVNSAKTD